MTRSFPASQEAPRVPAPVRRKRGRHVVLVGEVPKDWTPLDPGDVPPDGLRHSAQMSSGLTLAQAIAKVRSFNRDAMRRPGELWSVILFRPQLVVKGGAQ